MSIYSCLVFYNKDARNILHDLPHEIKSEAIVSQHLVCRGKHLPIEAHPIRDVDVPIDTLGKLSEKLRGCRADD